MNSSPFRPAFGVDVSVVMPVRDGAAVLPRSLGALAAQNATCTWELIVVDDGSRDASRAIAQRFAASMSHVRAVPNARSPGAAGARNTGIELAAGAVVAFCDADDRVDEGWVQAAYGAVRKGGAVSGMCRELREPFERETRVLNPAGVFHNAYGAAFRTCNAAVASELLREVGGFDESLGRYGHEDSELCVRLTKAGEPIRAARDMVVYFRETHERRSQVVKVWNLANAEYLYWARHPDKFAHLLDLDLHKAQVVGMVPHHLVRVVRRQPLAFEAMGRDVVTRLGRLRAALRWQRAGGIPPAQLLR